MDLDFHLIDKFSFLVDFEFNDCIFNRTILLNTKFDFHVKVTEGFICHAIRPSKICWTNILIYLNNASPHWGEKICCCQNYHHLQYQY